MKKNIFIALSTFGEYGKEPLEILNKSNISYQINPFGRRLRQEEVIELCEHAIGIVAGVEPYDYKVLKKLGSLKCISRAGVGLDNIDLDYAKERSIVIHNTPNVVVRPVVELTISMILDLLKRITIQTIYMRENRWEKIAGNLLYGKKIGIIGTGRIGKKVCKYLNFFGAKVSAYDIIPDLKWSNKNNINYKKFEELVSDSDVLSIHASASNDNSSIIGKDEVMLMKKGVFLINTARGNLINEDAMIYGLNSKIIGGIALDVFPNEPYKGPLLSYDNVVLTPHIATLTSESRLQMEIEATNNLIQELKE